MMRAKRIWLSTILCGLGLLHLGHRAFRKLAMGSELARVSNDLDPESSFAYVFFATNDRYACSVLVNIHRLQYVLESRYQTIVIASPDVPSHFIHAFEKRSARVIIEPPPPLANGSSTYYTLQKMMAFKLHKFDSSLRRILVLDADQLVLKNLDHLFYERQASFAAARAYWLADDVLSGTLWLIQPSEAMWCLVQDALRDVQIDVYDMDMVNDLFAETGMRLPGAYATINSHWEVWNTPRWFSDQWPYTANDIKDREPLLRVGEDDYLKPAGSIESTYYAALKPNDLAIRWKSGPQSPGDTVAITTSSSVEDLISSNVQNAGERYMPERGVHIYEALNALWEKAYVVHFFAFGKPWSHHMVDVIDENPDVHPIFLRQLEMWRSTARVVCPGNIVGQL